MQLRNKPPHWNESLRCWCLNFRGRVKLASVKNFQLISAADPTKAIAMQVGRPLWTQATNGMGACPGNDRKGQLTMTCTQISTFLGRITFVPPHVQSHEWRARVIC